MKPALLVIDMQNDFVKEGAFFEVKGIRRNIQDFRNFIDTCRDKG
ncbi:isochorismatase family protein, partial [Candidatus Woesearchaeota archaeon]|nr:isochorismatase family protein [Candidatus Woesearchaeota archaeon]